jgi:hypothetical protein
MPPMVHMPAGWRGVSLVVVELDPELSALVIAALAEGLPQGVRVKRRGLARLIVKSKPARSEWSTSSDAVFGHISRHAGPMDATEQALRAAIRAVSAHLESEALVWPGLDRGPVAIAIDLERGRLTARLSDPAGHVLQFPSIEVCPDIDKIQTADHDDDVAARSAATVAEWANAALTIDSIALWLLRVGIDHSGQVSLTGAWDVAVRAAVLADLRRAGRVSETDAVIEVDAEPAGVGYEDAACQQLLADPAMTELLWIQAGRLRAPDVAAELVESGEWSSRRAPLLPGMRIYRAPKQQHIPLRTRLAHTYDGDFAPRSETEAALAVLGHAVNVVRPHRLDLRRSTSQAPLQPEACGVFAPIVSAAVIEIRARAAANSANSNPTW